MAFPKQSDVEIPLLQALLDSGGSAEPRKVYPKVATCFPDLTPEEEEQYLESSPHVRKWWNLVQWVRQKLIQAGEIDVVITGSDRIAANGDAANKIGTYTIASLAKAHQVPFYIAAPSTSFDLSIASGDEIPIEQRSADEIWSPTSQQQPPEGIGHRNPAFDVTPASHIAGWITEVGILHPPFEEIRR